MDEHKRRRLTFYLCIVGPIAAGLVYFLVMKHWAHTLEFLPYLIFLLCPLLHVFMHGGHGHGSHGAERSGEGKHPTNNDERSKKG